MHLKPQIQKSGTNKVLLIVTMLVFTILISPWDSPNSVYAGVRPEQDPDVTEVGDFFQWFLPVAAFGSTFIARGPDGKFWDKEGTWQFTKSLGSTVATTEILKKITLKYRPNVFSSGGKSDQSFPSGHTSAAFAGASFINTRYGSWWGVPSYAAALYTAYSRVQADAHFLDDVTAGASIALLYNFLWVTPQSWSGKYTVMPMVGEDSTGIQFTMKLGDDVKSESDVKKVKNKDPRFRFNFGFGPAFTLKNEITSPSDGGTTFDLHEFEDAEDVLTTSAVEFDVFFGERHEISLFWIPFENRDKGSFGYSVDFAGQTYPANTNLISAWRQNEIKGAYHYNLTPEKDWQLKVGGGLFVQNTNIALATEDYSIESEVDDWVVLPILHGSIGYNFTPRWAVSLSGDGISLTSDTYLDLAAAVTYKISHNWDASLGYEYYNRDIETSELTNHTILSVPFLAVSYSW